MASINEWTINGTPNGRSAIFIAEGGNMALVKYEDRDVAYIQSNGSTGLLVNTCDSARVLIDSDNKVITVTPR